MRVVLGMGLVALLGACGASPRMVHQSSEYFERCHSADLDPARSVEERQACWSTWLEHYGERQRVERRVYASERLAALQQGEAVTPLPDIAVSTFAASFLSTSESEATEPEPAGPPRSPPVASSDPCVPVCGPRLAECRSRCDHRGVDCQTACRVEHRICLRGCF